MAEVLHYAWGGEALAPGDWVCVPLGRRKVVGLVVVSREAPVHLAREKIRSVERRLSIPRADPGWMALVEFCARYYRRPLGVVALSFLPKWCRDIGHHTPKKENTPSLFDRLLADVSDDAQGSVIRSKPEIGAEGPYGLPESLNPDQSSALASIGKAGVHVLHGVTGSGKTRVYTEAVRQCLAQHPQAQVLMMVPEIGLTPQLVDRFRNALQGITLAVLHSEVTERERARLWLSCARGQAQLVIGTRLSVMTPLPNLKLIMLDEEHDHSYKQQEGMRYNARDLAVWRSADLSIPLVLGSATPSVETWAQLARGRYGRLCLPLRATGEPPAPIRLVDTLRDPATDGLCTESRNAIATVLGEGGQVLVFLNRRGYAPVLSCASCGWTSQCRDCSVASVLHRTDHGREGGREHQRSGWKLQCHHCGLSTAVPRHCPECGDADLAPIGRGVQRLEQTLKDAFPQARIARIDRDTVRHGRALEQELAAIHEGRTDIVVGTQMLAKGHDFARMRLVVIADADTQLVNPDFRSAERLFATLMQVAGRAGRHEQSGLPAQVLLQTRYPTHRLYRFLLNQDVDGFIEAEMQDRRAAGLPPFSYMAAVRASHRDPAKAQSALGALRREIESAGKTAGAACNVYGPIARYPETAAGKWRGQILMESATRANLQKLLGVAEQWLSEHRALDAHLDVDPYEV